MRERYPPDKAEFNCISDIGLLHLWYSKTTPEYFEREIFNNLMVHQDKGLAWDVVVLYSDNPLYKTKKQYYFRVILPYLKDFKIKDRSKLFNQQLRICRDYMKLTSLNDLVKWFERKEEEQLRDRD